MAKVKKGNLSGKMGDVIHSSYLGRPYVRQKPEKVENPRTEAQQAHRTALVAIARLASDLKEAHKLGLHMHAQRNKLTTDSDFRKLNKRCCVRGAISYPDVEISKGSVENVSITSVDLDEQHVLHVTFGSNATDTNKKDKLGLFVYCPELRKCQALKPVFRTTGEVIEQLPEEFKGHELHLYGFLQGKKLYTSNTMYAAIAK
jgi:hypothetical protein